MAEGPPSLDTHIDNDFAGMWPTKPAHLHGSAVPRGCVIGCCGCPAHWVSKLHSKIALSSTEAECIALSVCMQDLISMHTLLFEPTAKLCIDDPAAPLTPAFCKAITTHHHWPVVWEDDTGCPELAMNPEQHRPQTKHVGVEWHHFWGQMLSGNIAVKVVDTTFDWADHLLTEPLTHGTHEQIRKLLLGW